MSGTLRKRGKHLLAESNSLAERFGEASRNLAETYAETQTAMAGLRLLGSAKKLEASTPRKSVVERVIEDSPDTVEALQQAAEILRMEFYDSEGSGRETLLKCERVLKRARRVWTIELPLD